MIHTTLQAYSKDFGSHENMKYSSGNVDSVPEVQHTRFDRHIADLVFVFDNKGRIVLSKVT